MCLLLPEHVLSNALLCVVCTVEYRQDMAPEVVGGMISQGFSDAEIDAAMSAPSGSGRAGVRTPLPALRGCSCNNCRLEFNSLRLAGPWAGLFASTTSTQQEYVPPHPDLGEFGHPNDYAHVASASCMALPLNQY